jgi:hypothetical protein
MRETYFYVVDGYLRLSAVLQDDFKLVPGTLIAESDESVTADLSAGDYFESELTFGQSVRL